MMFTGEAPRSKKDIDRLIASIKEVEKMPAGTDVIILSWQEMKEEPVSSVEFW